MLKQLQIYMGIILLFQVVQLKANDLCSIIDFADSLRLNRDYTRAVQEYRRAYYFAGPEYKAPLSEKIASCYMNVENYKMARMFYDSAFHYSPQEQYSLYYLIQKAVTYMLEENFPYALFKFDEIETGGNEELEKLISLYRGICYFGMEKYDDSHRNLLNSVPDTDTNTIFLVNNLFEDSKSLKRPNSALASIFSIFLPGSGQLYSGEFMNGMNSLVLVGGLLYLGIAATAVHPLVTIPITYRYYMGGIINAGKAAEKRRAGKRYEYFTSLMEILPDTVTDMEYLFTPDRPGDDYSLFLQNADSELKVLVSISFLFYKEFISSQDVDACVFHPSCSEYTVRAVESKGALIGMLDGIDRLLRCHRYVTEKDYPFDYNTFKFYDPL